MKKLSVIAALIAASLFVSPVEAGVFGSAYQNIKNARIEFSTDGGTTWNVAQANVIGGNFIANANSLSSATATLNGFTVGGVSFGTSPNASIAYIGADGTSPAFGPADNTAFTPGAVPANAFPSYALADVGSTGSLVDSGNADVKFISSTQIDDAGFLSQADALGNLTSQASLAISQIAIAGLYRFTGDFYVQLDTIINPPPINYIVTAISSFQVNAERTRAGQTTKVPTVERNDTLISGVTNQFIFSGTLSTNALALNVGDTATFTIQNATTVSTAIIPEPTSVLTFATLGLVGLIRLRRRS